MKKLTSLLILLLVLFVSHSCDKNNEVVDPKTFVGEWINKEGFPDIPREYDYKLVVEGDPPRVIFYEQRGLTENHFPEDSYVQNDTLYWFTSYRSGKAYFKQVSDMIYVRFKLFNFHTWNNAELVFFRSHNVQ